MAPRKAKQPVLHDNGSMETVLNFKEQTKKTKPKGTAKLKTTRGKKKPASKEDDTTCDTTSGGPSDTEATGFAHHEHFAQEDEQENPFLADPRGASATPRPQPRSQNVRFAAPLTPAQLSHLVSAAIPASETPRAGRHSPMRASPEVAKAQKKKRFAAKDVTSFFELKRGRKFCKFCLHKQKTSKDILDHPDSYSSSTATGNLRRHLYTCHLDEWLESCNKLGIKITATDTGLRDAIADYNHRHGARKEEEKDKGPTPTYRPFSPEAFVDAIVEWIVADDQSINVIENPHLRSIFLMLRKELRNKDIPHRTTIRNHVLEMWEQYLQDLEKEMKSAIGKISFTADCWTDANLTPFMAITAHWIDAQAKKSSRGTQYTVTLRAELIAFHRVPGRHTGEHLAAVFMSIIDRFHIEKTGWFTLDNASNNDTMMEELEDLLTARGITFSADDRRIRCFPHIINLAVQAILSAITNMEFAKDDSEDFDPTVHAARDIIATLRTLINQIRASSLRRDQFAKVQENYSPKATVLQLIRDVSTRWSSTHLMICRALQLRRPIEIYIIQNKDLHRYKLSESEWKIVEAYAKILAVPHAFQQKLSSEKTPTLSDALPSFQRMIAVWKGYQQEMPIYSTIIEAGISKLTDYFNKIIDVPAFQLAILLNPTKKLRWFRENLPQKADTVRQLLIDHLTAYEQETTPTSNPAPETHAQEVSTPFSDDDWADDILGDKSTTRSSDAARSIKDEVDDYLLDISPASTNIIAFWQENQNRYPTIFKLALDILAIQGSAVPCERVFSSGKETMTARRNRIKSDLMEALQMLKFSFRKGCHLNFTAGTSRKDELESLEDAALGDAFVPEDLTSFTATLMAILEEGVESDSFDDSDSSSESD